MGAHGYFGVAVWQSKTDANFGGILRSAHAFGASFVILIGDRFFRHATDTSKAVKSLPVYRYETLEEFQMFCPMDCEIVRVEVDGEKALPGFTHLPRAIYLFGGEDRTLPKSIGQRSVRIETAYCLNLASTATVVMYDRAAKGVAHG